MQFSKSSIDTFINYFLPFIITNEKNFFFFKQDTLMHFQFQFTVLVFLTLIPRSYPINSNARTSTAFTLSTASTERESIDRAIHFKTVEESARQRHFEEWQTEKPSEIDRSLSMSRLYRRPYIIMPISRLRDLETLRFFFLRMYRYAWDPGAWNHEFDPQNIVQRK